MLTRLMDISVTARMDTVECAVKLVSTCSFNSYRCLAGHGPVLGFQFLTFSFER